MSQHSKIQVPGLTLHVEEQGEGAPVLFIGGTGADLRQKPNVLDGPLARAFHVIAYDQRGLGQTDKPEGPFTMADYADDAAALLDALGHEQVDVVGVSFGGMVAQHLAIRHPQRIRRLVLCCTSPGGDMPSYPFHELPDDLSPVDRMLQLMSVSDTRRDEAWQSENPEFVEKMKEQVQAGAIKDHEKPDYRRGAKLQLEARAGHDTLAQLPALSMPVLICAGRYDGIAPATNQEKLHELITGSELKWYEGGHLFIVQDKSAWTDIVTFLS